MEMAASWPLDVPRGIRRGLSTYEPRVTAPATGLGALPTRRYFTVTCVTPRVKDCWPFRHGCATVNPDKTVGIHERIPWVSPHRRPVARARLVVATPRGTPAAS